jgi:hypothetical protein
MFDLFCGHAQAAEPLFSYACLPDKLPKNKTSPLLQEVGFRKLQAMIFAPSKGTGEYISKVRIKK